MVFPYKNVHLTPIPWSQGGPGSFILGWIIYLIGAVLGNMYVRVFTGFIQKKQMPGPQYFICSVVVKNP